MDLSSCGSLLVAATSLEVRFFRLRPRTEGTIKVTKIEVPASFTQGGARSVQIAPNSKWIALVRLDNSIHLYKLKHDDASNKVLYMLHKPVPLRRLSRDGYSETAGTGALGGYDRSIIRAAFSSDSRILTVGDISGYIDSWVLEGYEDTTQDDNDSAHDASSESSHDDEDDQERHLTVVHGQHWIRNPAASLIPKLTTAPSILSFRPMRTPDQRSINGTTMLHSTRRTPHPHSHDLPDGDDRLLVLTADHHLYEFHVLEGKLTEWSRRNPPSCLPSEFKGVRDVCMGSVWDTNQSKERLWLYGSSWLWMLDLSRDFSSFAAESEDMARHQGHDAQDSALKRKRQSLPDADTLRKPKRKGTGAGSQVLDSELGGGIGRKLRIVNDKGPDFSETIHLGAEDLSSDPDDDGPMPDSALVTLRRAHGDEASNLNAPPRNIDGAKGKQDHKELTAVDAAARPSHWRTYKYRPILGIVPLNRVTEAEDEDPQSPSNLEVALVERPLWATDLPPKYYGDQEWHH